MTSTTELKRKSDGKLFRVIELAHWSLVTSKNPNHEEFRVKWLGGKEYISHDGVVFVEAE